MSKRWGWLLVGAVLAGCAHPAAPGVNATGVVKAASLRAAAFFPTKPGTIWQYEVLAHPADDPYADYPGVETVKIENATRTSRGTVLELRAIDTFTNSYRFPTLTIDEQHAVLGGVTYWGPVADTPDTLKIDFLHFPPTVGQKWDDGDWFGSVTKEEAVKVPAGTFQTHKVGVVGTYDQEYTAVGDYWMAPGMGPVKYSLNNGAWTFDGELIPAGKSPKRKPVGALPQRK